MELIGYPCETWDNNDISIKLSMEVSSILSRDTVGGSGSATTVVTIGTRNLDTVLNLRDGETSIIGGLIQNNSNKSKQKVFLIGDLPIIGPLLSSSVDTNDKSELILAVTPHIVRGITIPEADVASFWSGKEDEPTVNKIYQSFVQEPELVQPAPAPGTPAAIIRARSLGGGGSDMTSKPSARSRRRSRPDRPDTPSSSAPRDGAAP